MIMMSSMFCNINNRSIENAFWELQNNVLILFQILFKWDDIERFKWFSLKRQILVTKYIYIKFYAWFVNLSNSCRVPPQRTKTSSDNTNISALHAGTEINHNTSRFRGISRENENVNGDPYHTLKNQGLLEISTSYDTFATADRFNKHGDQNWNATNRCDVPAFPSDNLHVVRNTTAVNSHATQSSGRPYSLQNLWDEKGWETKVFSSDCS